MPLQGTFDVLDFSEVLRLLARQQLTGRLHVRSRSYGANLFLEEGALVGADQSEHQAAAASGDVRGRLEEICFEMLDAERGGFEFQPGRPSSLPATTKLPVDSVLARARKRLQEWQELQELIPSLDLQPRLVDDLGSTAVTIDQERWRMLTVIDGRRSLRAIGRTLNLSDFDVCRVIKTLLDEGIVELDARATALAAAAREAIAPPVAAIDTPAVHEVVRVTERAAAAVPQGGTDGRANGKPRTRSAPGSGPDGEAAGAQPGDGAAEAAGAAAVDGPLDDASPAGVHTSRGADAGGEAAAASEPAAGEAGGEADAAKVDAGQVEPEDAASPAPHKAPEPSGAAAAARPAVADPGNATGTAAGAAPLPPADLSPAPDAPAEPGAAVETAASADPGGDSGPDGAEAAGDRPRRRRVVRIRSRTLRDDNDDQVGKANDR